MGNFPGNRVANKTEKRKINNDKVDPIIATKLTFVKEIADIYNDSAIPMPIIPLKIIIEIAYKLLNPESVLLKNKNRGKLL